MIYHTCLPAQKSKQTKNQGNIHIIFLFWKETDFWKASMCLMKNTPWKQAQGENYYWFNSLDKWSIYEMQIYK